MSNMRRAWTAASLAAASFVAGCSDGLLRPPAPASPASVAIAASLQLNNGGINEAYQKVDSLSVRFLAGAEERMAETVPFDPNAAETVVSLQVPLNEVTESFNIELALLAGSQTQFRGSGSAQLSAGGAREVVIPIVPVVNAVTCAGPTLQIRVYQVARRITGAALFASGDTVPGVPLAWSTSDPAVATVSQAGDVFGQQDGSATITCTAQGLSSTRQAQVLAAVASLQVLPAADTVVVGATATFTTALRDSLGHAITTARATSWSSSNSAVASVTAGGQVTGVATGTAIITATSGGASGTATLLVLSPPSATTLAATSIGATGATLNGRANPQGLATQVWFEYSTSATMASGVISTTAQQAGSGASDLSFSAPVTGLTSNQTHYFRIVASSNGGTTRGAILSFTPPSAPSVRTISGTAVGAGATLQGGVNPQGLAAQAWFEWSTSPSLTGAQSTAVQNLAAGIRTEQTVSATLSNLSPGVTYWFRAAASNSVGTAYGSIMSVTVPMPPSVSTQAPTAVTGSQATLQGTVNPNGASTSAWFEWSQGRTFTTVNSTTAQAVGSGTSAQSFAQVLPNLQPSTTYIYRVAANNSVGTTRGTGMVFTTGGAPFVITGTATWQVNPFYDIGYWLITGDVVPNGEATTAWIEWTDGWNDPTFARPTLTTAVSVGSGYTSVPISGVSYTFTSCLLYRAAAQNRFGTRYGTVQSNGCIG